MTYSNIAKAFVAAGFVLGGVTASYAQGPGGLVDNLSNNMGFIGETNTMGPNCPPMELHVTPKGKNELQGVAWTTEEGGMRIYTVTGTLADNGSVAMDLKPVAGGPGSKVEGSFKHGMLMAKMGTGTCHAGGFMMMMPYARPAIGLRGGGG